MKVIIIEDEGLVAQDLSLSLKKVKPEIEIVCILSSVGEALEYFRGNKECDLIFSDIQLGDGLSFEITKEVMVNAPIIFCTAYDEYAIEAFKTNGIAYILKPFTTQSLEKALAKFESLKASLAIGLTQQYKTAVEALSVYKLKESGSFMVKYRDRILPLNLNNIALFYLEHEANHLFTHAGKIYYISESLDEIERKLAPMFFRVNRQYLINRNAISDVTEHFPRKLRINLSIDFDKEITVSKERRVKVLDWLATTQ